jgi:uncharacterized protein YneF (UPF0154 family)
MPKTYRVSRRELEKGEKIERKEHPSLSDRMVRRVAKDHLTSMGPGYYEAEPVTEKIVEAKTKQMGVKPKRRHVERAYDPMTDGLPRHARGWDF